MTPSRVDTPRDVAPPMISGAVTPRMAECLDAVRRLTVCDVPPTLEEIRTEMGLCSRGNVHHLLTRLEERGLLTRDPRIPRSIRLVLQPNDFRGMPTERLLAMWNDIQAELIRRGG